MERGIGAFLRSVLGGHHLHVFILNGNLRLQQAISRYNYTMFLLQPQVAVKYKSVQVVSGRPERSALTLRCHAPGHAPLDEVSRPVMKG